jgi:Ca2+-transporting ATPase
MVGALIVGAVAAQTWLAPSLAAPASEQLLDMLSQLGIEFLLFFVGLQIDLQEVDKRAREVLLLTLSTTLTPFVLGTALMLALGYDGLRACVVGLTLVPTAEVVVVPILDEFGLLRTRVGQLIVGAGTLDDLLEVALIAVASLWLGTQTSEVATAQLLTRSAAGMFALATLYWFAQRWCWPRVARWLPAEPHMLVMFSMFVLIGFVALSAASGLGTLIGSLLAGLLMRKLYVQLGIAGEQATQAFRNMGYGFFGAIFFLRVGMSIDIFAVLLAPWLALAIFAAGAAGKLGGVWLLRWARRVTPFECWVLGIGLDARLTTETIVAQLLYRAKLIPLELFSAIVAAAALSTIAVPVALSVVLRSRGETLLEPVQVEPLEVGA